MAVRFYKCSNRLNPKKDVFCLFSDEFIGMVYTCLLDLDASCTVDELCMKSEALKRCKPIVTEALETMVDNGILAVNDHGQYATPETLLSTQMSGSYLVMTRPEFV